MLSRSVCWGTYTLLWKRWDDEPIAYNVESGNTHLLNPLAAKILRQLQQHPSTLSRVSHHVAAEVEVDSDEELIEHVERLISNLDELGLVKPYLE
jgi:PqqD family protein of HPr-rel-A system